MLKRIIYLLLFILGVGSVQAQVTTSSIIGTARDNKGQGLSGATVTAVHTPSGTSYSTIAGKEGVFTLPNLRIGGPYTVTVNYVGLQPFRQENINLLLGEPFSLNTVLSENATAMETVVVTGTARRNVDRTGATTNVGARQIATLPSISRSITDFTRLTPQANGNNIAGRDARFNNVTVDGANLNNNFGLSSDPLPGGGNNPISLDAIEEISVSISPYDVRQSNFTGGNIAAVTKSGTNTFRGTAYTFYRDQSFVGTEVAGSKLPDQAKTKSTIFGASLGGPIIKNKLFFFANAEFENRTTPPGTSYTPRGGSRTTGNISNTHVDSLSKLSNFLRSTYGYETGAYDNFGNFGSENNKVLFRLDWNISKAHKLTAKYNHLISYNDVALNSTSVPNQATGGPNAWQSVARFGANAFSFENSNYGFDDIVRSGAIELNSNFSSKFSNQFIANYTKINATRSSPSQVFPFIDIIGPTPYSAGGRNNYMSAGYEPYSYNNDVKNDVVNIIDNFTYFAGKHTLTAGIAYEYQNVGNMFMPASQSYYTYGSLQDFMTGARPIAFALTFSRVEGKEAVYSAELKYGQLSFYAQDEYNVNPRLRIVGGIRFDKPVYPEQPLENPSITALTFPDQNGKLTNYSTGQWPKSRVYASPRVAVRWDVEGNRNMIIRAGTGIYTGRLPFVYLTNMPTNSGMYQVNALANATQLSQITFNPNPNAWRSLFTAPTPQPNTGGFVLIDPNFKFPQVWRTNFGLDKQLGRGWTANLDILYTKDINSVHMRNLNELEPTSTVNVGGGITRPSFANSATATRRKYNAYANAVVLENNDFGHAFSFTPQISKSFASGFYGSLAYTYTFAQDVTANPGSQASSTWSGNPTVGTQNDLELYYSQYAVPHRIIGSASYRLEYLKHLASTVSIFYEGASQGSYTYIYGAATGTAPTGFSNTADINYDGNNSDLMYIPRDASQITFVPLTVGTGATAVTYTAQQQSDAFFKFLEQDPYLSKQRGQNAERNGARYPFYHRVDLRFLQDIFTNVGSRKNTLQVSFDFTNFLNFLNDDWGVRQFFVVNNPLRATKNATTGEVRYQLATYTPSGATTPVLIDRTFVDNVSTTSTWGLQVGLRYIFKKKKPNQ
jgi:hypothetical protein